MNAHDLALELEQTPFESTRIEAAALLRRQQSKLMLIESIIDLIELGAVKDGDIPKNLRSALGTL